MVWLRWICSSFLSGFRRLMLKRVGLVKMEGLAKKGGFVKSVLMLGRD